MRQECVIEAITSTQVVLMRFWSAYRALQKATAHS